MTHMSNPMSACHANTHMVAAFVRLLLANNSPSIPATNWTISPAIATRSAGFLSSLAT